MQNLTYGEHNIFHKLKQVDILISENQALQILYLNIMYIKLHKIIMDKKLTKS